MTNPCAGVLMRRFPLAANNSWLARPPAAALSQAEALESRNMGMHLRIRQQQEAPAQVNGNGGGKGAAFSYAS